MSKSNVTISAGIALLASLSANGNQVNTVNTEITEIAADTVEDLIAGGQIKIDQKGSIKIDKTIFDILRERGILKDNVGIQSSTDTFGGKCKSK